MCAGLAGGGRVGGGEDDPGHDAQLPGRAALYLQLPLVLAVSESTLQAVHPGQDLHQQVSADGTIAQIGLVCGGCAHMNPNTGGSCCREGGRVLHFDIRSTGVLWRILGMTLSQDPHTTLTHRVVLGTGSIGTGTEQTTFWKNKLHVTVVEVLSVYFRTAWAHIEAAMNRAQSEQHDG